MRGIATDPGCAEGSAEARTGFAGAEPARPPHLTVNPEIGDYAMIGDCRTAALVSREGSIDWLCLPHFSAPSIFARLLDPNGGHFSIRPRQPFRATRRYIADTAVLETRFETANGVVLLRDALVVLDGVAPMRPMRELIRTIEGIAGAVELIVEVVPKPDYGRIPARLRRHRDIGWAFFWDNEILFLRSEHVLQPNGRALGAVIDCAAGSKYCLSLSHTKGDIAVIPQLGSDAQDRVDQTLAWWNRWSSHCSYDGPYRDAVFRSAVTLKQLTYSLSGALVAAATTSIPETIGHDDTWDYRYCWLRDAGLTAQAFAGLGFLGDAAAYLGWLLHATRLTWPRLRVMYDIYGRQSLREDILTHLAGYRDSRPVRIGNKASIQLQLDCYGHVILAAEKFAAAGGRFGPAEARMLLGLGKTVCEDWRRADSGIWEIRGPRRQYTFSKLMCWVALDRLLKLHEQGRIAAGHLAARFRTERDAIADIIETRGFNPELQTYTSELDGSQLDATLLLMGLLGYKRADDPRFAQTVDRIMERLSRNGLIFRYEPGYDGRRRNEASFGICTFWAVEVFAAQGEIAIAENLFEHALSCANDVGLLGEEIGVDDGSIAGNFPQAFTHVGVINAALGVERAKREQNR
jgi:GH15 family glucan-1,4-alpha-glucosidase